MERLLQEFNPVNVLLGDNRTSSNELMLRDFVDKRLRRVVAVQQDDVLFPLEGLMRGGGGKFGNPCAPPRPRADPSFRRGRP
eukprot:tig00021043_g17610.t1